MGDRPRGCRCSLFEDFLKTLSCGLRIIIHAFISAIHPPMHSRMSHTHAITHAHTNRLGVAVLALCWLLCYPRALQIRTLICALLYSATEFTFTCVATTHAYDYSDACICIPLLLSHHYALSSLLQSSSIARIYRAYHSNSYPSRLHLH